MSLRTMLEDRRASIGAVAEHLDGLGPEARADEVLALDRAGQRRLYELAASAAPLSLADFVAPDVAPRVQVRHRGKNSLPLPDRLRLFEKRFCRPDDGSDRLFGYNHSAINRRIGPGYFVVVSTAHEPAWRERGSVVIDYYRVPERAVVPGWPPVVPNSRGIQFFIQNGTRDFMRRVSEGVTIGSAYKGNHKLDSYFVLVRQPPG